MSVLSHAFLFHCYPGFTRSRHFHETTPSRKGKCSDYQPNCDRNCRESAPYVIAPDVVTA